MDLNWLDEDEEEYWEGWTDHEYLSDHGMESFDEATWLTYLTECDWLWLYGLDDVLDTFYIN